MVLLSLIGFFLQPAWATDEVPSSRGLVILAREAWGCFVRQVVLVGVDNFLPHLSQKIALKKPDGKLVGAELWICAEP